MISLSQFLFFAFRARMFYLRSWRIQMSMNVTEPKTAPFYPYVKEGKYYFNDENGQALQIDVPYSDKPLLTWKDEFELLPDHLPGVSRTLTTRYGIWLVNVIGWIATYGDKVTYINEPMNPGTLKKKYTQIYNDGLVTDNKAYLDAISDLETLFSSDCEFGVKSSSRVMMMDDKEGDKLRKQMLKEYGDKINDPVVQAEFDARLIEHKKKIVEKSGAKDYYGKGGKLYGTILMKTDGRFGSEKDTAGNETPFIAKSLKEGLDMDQMENWVNPAINGSYSRGALTALSGADVKEVMRAMASLMVDNTTDCKTKVGQKVRVSQANSSLLEGVYEVGKEKDGLMSPERIKQLIGKVVEVRSPSGCQMPPDLYCQTCMGRSTKPNGVPNGCADLDSTLMYVSMKAAHSFSKEARKLDLIIHTS